MPATATGRGAQVIVDPGSDTGRAIRGSYANTLEANTAKVRADVLAGAFPSGNNTADGTTETGGAANDPMMSTNAVKIIDQSNAAISHTGDIVQFAFKVVPIPAGAMGPNGVLRVTTLWSFTGTATKNAAVTFSNTAGVGPGNVINQTITTQLTFNDMRMIRNANSVAAQKFFAANTNTWGIGTPGIATLTVNTAAVSYVNLLGTLTAGAESITLEGYTVELLRLN